MTLKIISLFRQSRSGVASQLPHQPPHRASDASFEISRIDDPYGSATIIAGRGTLDARGLDALWDSAEQLGGVTSVHVDLHQATIPAGPWMAELEQLGEALETAGLQVRIVGVDPTHPDLGCRH